MRVIRFETSFICTFDGKALLADTDYVVLRGNVPHYSGAVDGFLSVASYVSERPFDATLDWNDKRILVHRGIGLGDLILIKPLLHALKQRWPKVHISLHCEEKHHWVLAHTPDVDAYVAPPLTRDFLQTFDAELDLEGVPHLGALDRNQVLKRTYEAVTGIEVSNHHLLGPVPSTLKGGNIRPAMRTVRFERECVDGANNRRLKAATDYVMPRELVSYHALLSEGFLSVKPYQIPEPFTPDADWNGKRILIHRSGSAGDLLFITPLLRELKKRWPACQITFNCEKKYHWVLAHNTDVQDCLSPPLEKGIVDEFDAQIDLESASEYNPLSRTLPLTEVYASVAGIVLSNPLTVYAPLASQVDTVARRFPKTTKRVGVSLTSDGIARNYPQPLSLEVIGMLMRRNIQVVLLGKVPTGVARQPLFIDLAGEHPGLSWEESVAFMTTCDLVLGPDSSAIHFAGAMGVPSLGLFGPFPANLRIPSQPATQAIQGQGVCSPCFHHGRGNVEFPPYGPCALTGQCEVLASIKPADIAAQICAMIGA